MGIRRGCKAIVGVSTVGLRELVWFFCNLTIRRWARERAHWWPHVALMDPVCGGWVVHGGARGRMDVGAQGLLLSHVVLALLDVATGPAACHHDHDDNKPEIPQVVKSITVAIAVIGIPRAASI